MNGLRLPGLPRFQPTNWNLCACWNMIWFCGEATTVYTRGEIYASTAERSFRWGKFLDHTQASALRAPITAGSTTPQATAFESPHNLTNRRLRARVSINSRSARSMA